MGLDWFSSGPASKLDQYWAAMDNSSEQIIDHQLWQQTLDDYLVEDSSGVNLVDYEGLKDSPEELDQYIQYMSSIDPRKLNRNEQMSFWINLYNALTVQLIANNYPVESIRELGDGLFSSGPWDDELIRINDRDLTLNDIEHRILRPIFDDYRIHFAVNCASIGCPNLAAEAFNADNLNALLDQGARSFLRHERGVSLEADELRLSSLFKWYRDDFGDSEADMLKTLGKYLKPEQQSVLRSFKGDIEYEYDWLLNDLG